MVEWRDSFLNLTQQEYCGIRATCETERKHRRARVAPPAPGRYVGPMMRFAPAISTERVATAARQFAKFGHVRIEPVLSVTDATALKHHLEHDAPWHLVVNQGTRTWDLDAAMQAGLGPEQVAALKAAAYEQARDGFQFLYESVRVSDDPAERAARGLPVDRLVDALNTPEWLDVFRTIAGAPDVNLIDGQATRYRQGDFLTAHDDNVAGKGRVAAYVLSLTPDWRTEWGGLLQFHDRDGDVSHALRPRFNAIHLLRVPQVHSVSAIAPYAGAARYSITGWLRMAA